MTLLILFMLWHLCQFWCMPGELYLGFSHRKQEFCFHSDQMSLMIQWYITSTCWFREPQWLVYWPGGRAFQSPVGQEILKKIDAGSPDRQLKMKRLLEIRWLSWYGQHHLSRACSIKVCCQHHILPIPESMDKGPWLSKHIFVTYGSVPWLLSRTIFCLLYLSQLYIIAWYNCSFFFCNFIWHSPVDVISLLLCISTLVEYIQMNTAS